jgi:hypothetical protein
MAIINGVKKILQKLRLLSDIEVGGDLTLTGGGTIDSDLNGDIKVKPHGTGLAKIGDAAAAIYISAPANGDLLITKQCEIVSDLICRNNNRTIDNKHILVGTDQDSGLIYSTAPTTPGVDTMFMKAPVSSYTVALVRMGAVENTIYKLPLQTHPSFVVLSNDSAEPDQYSLLRWNALMLGGGKASYCNIKATAIEEVTIPVGQGAGGVATAGNLAPANSLIFGAAVRVTDAPGGGATELDVGITASGNQDELIDGIAVALGTTGVSPTNNDGTQLPIANGSATTLTLTTDANVTVDEMKVRVVVYYMEMIAPTS